MSKHAGEAAPVTGGTRAIGAAIALRRAPEGADVALTHLSPVAGLIAWLAGEEGRFVTGAVFTIDGGAT